MNSLNSLQIDALDRAQRQPELCPFLFRKIKGLKWFDELQKRNFFNPSENPAAKETEDKGYYMIPVWPVLEYLEKTAPELQIAGNEEYADKFLQITRSTTKTSIETAVSNYRTWRYFAKVIKYIPIGRITADDIDLCAYWLKDPFDRMLVGDELGNHFLPKLLEDKTEHSFELSLKLVEALTQLRWVEKQWGVKKELEPILYIEDWHANKLFCNQSRKIGKTLEQNGLNIFKARIEEILNKYGKDEYSPIWRPAIEDHEQNKNHHDALNILITGFRDALSGYIEEHIVKKAREVFDYISDLLKSKFRLFHRIAINAIGVYFDVLNPLISNIIDPIYFTSHYRHELFYLLKNNFTKLEEDDKKKVLQIIDSLTIDNNENEDIKKKQIAYKKLIWLMAVKDKGYEPADKLYSQYFAVIGVEPEHPDFSSYMEVGWVGEVSPYKAEELLSQGIDELLDIIDSFQEQGGWKTPTKRGLAEAFKQAIKINPDYFKGNLSEFLTVDLAYICEIIQAFKELWTEKKFDNWAEVLEFCDSIIKREEFWSEENNKRRESFIANRSWIVGAIGELLHAGTANDETAFDPSLLPKAKNLLLKLLEKKEGEEFEANSDAVFVSINSPRGKCIEALVNFALRCCRLSDKEKGNHDEAWKDLQPIFNKELMRSGDNNFEFVTLYANYLPNFLYLNRDWTLRNLSQVFSFTRRKHWLYAMQGYAYVSAVYPDIYRFLSKEGHFIEALNASELREETKRKVIQNIVVAYIQGEESLENGASLINILLDRWNAGELNELIWFIWTIRDQNEVLYKKVRGLWEKISGKVANREEENKKLLSMLCLWSVFISELNNDTLQLLKQVAPYAEVNHHSYILIEELRRLVVKYPLQVAEIFISMLENFPPTYKEEDIKYILQTLYKDGDLEIRKRCNEIVEKYIKYGIEFPAKLRKEFK